MNMGKSCHLQVTDSAGVTTNTLYDTHGRVVKVQKKDPFGQMLYSQDQYFDLLGLPVHTKDTIFSPNQPPKSISTRRDYDSMGRLLRHVKAAGTPEQQTFLLHYNPFGQKDCFTKPDGVTLNYTYDVLGRLENLTSSDKTISYLYTFDALNNIKTVVDPFDPKKTTVRTHDKQSRLIAETLENGLQISNEYDHQGRLTS